MEQNRIFQIISGIYQAVILIQPFKPRTNISKTFLFPWLHHGESIFDFEKSTFFMVMQFFTLWEGKVWLFLGPQMEFKSILRAVEYSEGSQNFIFEKYNISAFKRRLGHPYIFMRKLFEHISIWKRQKIHPGDPFARRVSK